MKTKQVNDDTLIKLYQLAYSMDCMIKDTAFNFTESQQHKISSYAEQLRYQLGYITGDEKKYEIDKV